MRHGSIKYRTLCMLAWHSGLIATFITPRPDCAKRVRATARNEGLLTPRSGQAQVRRRVSEEDIRAIRIPRDNDPDLRNDRALQGEVRTGNPGGDVHIRRQGRPQPGPETRVHGIRREVLLGRAEE